MHLSRAWLLVSFDITLPHLFLQIRHQTHVRTICHSPFLLTAMTEGTATIHSSSIIVLNSLHIHMSTVFHGGHCYIARSLCPSGRAAPPIPMHNFSSSLLNAKDPVPLQHAYVPCEVEKRQEHSSLRRGAFSDDGLQIRSLTDRQLINKGENTNQRRHAVSNVSDDT